MRNIDCLLDTLLYYFSLYLLNNLSDGVRSRDKGMATLAAALAVAQTGLQPNKRDVSGMSSLSIYRTSELHGYFVWSFKGLEHGNGDPSLPCHFHLS